MNLVPTLRVGRALSDRVLKRPLKVRKIPRKTIEWFESKIEDQQERLMSTVLAKDISTIQVYQLRKKLNRYSSE
jgi:hypothetical protein